MTKIMLVEDDKSLREIYGVRLIAEGYEIISVGDGEAALAAAVKEKPDLILSDVMMPKISGFDMLDILRSTPETKDVKVIMMTALSSEDQRARGESLGADRYLVKSQVGIEDVVRTVHEVLADSPIVAQSNVQRFSLPVETAVTAPTQVQQPSVVEVPETVQPQQVPETVVVEPVNPVVGPIQAPVQAPKSPVELSTLPPDPQPVNITDTISAPETITPTPPQTPQQNVQNEMPASVNSMPSQSSVQPQQAPPTIPVAPIAPVEVPQPTAPPVAPIAPVQLPQPTAPFSTPAPASLGDRVINPITPQAPPADIATMMSQELNDPSITPTNQTPPQF